MLRIMSALLISVFALSAHAGRPSVDSGSTYQDPRQQDEMMIVDAIKEQFKNDQATLDAINGGNWLELDCRGDQGIRDCTYTFRVFKCDDGEMGSQWINVNVNTRGVVPGATITVDPQVKGGCNATAFDE